MGSKIVFDIFSVAFAAAADIMDAVRSGDTRRSRSANRQRRRRGRSRVINMRGQSSSTSNKSTETNNKAAAMRSRHSQARSSRDARTRRRSGSRRPVSSSCSSSSEGTLSDDHPSRRSRASRSQQANIIPAAANQQTIPQNITMLMKSEALAARQVVIDC